MKKRNAPSSQQSDFPYTFILMPTNKHPMQYQLDDTYYEKFIYIMNKSKRKSKSDMSIAIVEAYIDEWEKKNHEILL